MTDNPTGQGLTHLRGDGSAHMVDVTDKAITKRTARAESTLVTRVDVVDLLMTGELPKGEALGTARIAGIMAAKRTSELIPLCHPLPLTKLSVDFEAQGDRVRVLASVTTRGLPGVEPQAPPAAGLAPLTLYDMIKAVDKHASITDTRVLAKAGGKSGDWSIE